jgi:tubulin polyglutamylase TTLL1
MTLYKDKFQVPELVQAMKQIAMQCIRATYFKIDPKCLHHNLEIFGLDFIVDRSFRPWLLEVNTNPCLELSSQLLRRLIPSMVENALRIGLDPIFPPDQ